jgi:hypothetical protein
MVGRAAIRLASVILLALVVWITGLGGEASAHVKWFCAYDVAGQPRGLENVLCPDFEQLLAVAILTLLAGCLLEGTSVGNAMVRSIDRVTAPLVDNVELTIRIVGGFFFVSLWAMGGILLTPELKTTMPLVPWLQLGMATCLIWRRTLPLTALGIVILFGLATKEYGAFHLADYPIFLGVAAYLALRGFDIDFFRWRPVDVVRWSAAITLMWASVEKWAFPQWSFPLFITHPSVTMGFDGEFFMRAAGVVEFVLAFSLIWTPLVRRFAAIILTAMFVSATFEFGKIDVLGHAPIIAVLLAIIADRGRPEVEFKPHPLLAPAAFAASLALFLALYYGSHTMLYGTSLT